MRAWFLVAVALAGVDLGRPTVSPLDRATTRVWPAKRAWDDRMEAEYAVFVETLGDAVEARRCLRLDECLADPRANPTYDAATDDGLRLDVDCADLPYVLRAYFSFKRQLPFGFVAAARGVGIDLRLADQVEPTAWSTWRDFRTPRALFRALVDSVHTGLYRIVDEGDYYPVRVDRRSIRPGTVYYDPLGHVSVVARVTDDGVVSFIEGTPQGILTWRRFGTGYKLGTAAVGGGFKRFRPQALARGRLVRADALTLPDYDPTSQYDGALRLVGGRPVRFHEWVEAKLGATPREPDAATDFHFRLRALCRELVDRAEAVDIATRAGTHELRHPRGLPPNIYSAGGLWETYSTPARDARLRAGFAELAEWTADLDDLLGLSVPLREIWEEEARSPACRVAYLGSSGAPVVLTLDDIVDRLFDLSFDPYHCPELRWGAPAGSAERSACLDPADDLAWYEAERRLRNRIDRGAGEPTSLRDGPESPPDVDVRRLITPQGPPLDL